MSDKFKICEHESVEWILKKIPKFTKLSFIKKLNINITQVEVNLDVFVVGTNTGMLFIIDRKNEHVESLMLKKNIKICYLKLIRTVDLAIAVGFNDGSIYVLIIPFNDNLLFSELIQFIIPSDHKTTISSLSWSKNSEKLFSGDINGLICCTEINHQQKTVSTYEIYKTQSEVFQLVYYHNLLLISTEIETFLWNCLLNKPLQIGNQPRKQRGRFGVSFVNKLCKNEEMKLIVARPNGKVWISDVKGCIEKTISLKSEMLFGHENLISLLPCITSQSKNEHIDISSPNKTRYQLGFIISINESEVLFWSNKAIVIIDIISGNIIASTCNLGVIQSVSVCHVKILNPNGNNVNASDLENSNQNFYEIWILRQPIIENDSRLVRLSVIPLKTSKMMIDPFYFFSQAKIINKENQSLNNDISFKDYSKLKSTDDEDINNKENNIISNDAYEENCITNEEPNAVKNGPNLQVEHWLNKFGQNIDVAEALNDMRSNVLELTKKTKEVMKQGQLIFENDTEGLEQAIELTEEGLVITFDNNIESPCQTKHDMDYKSDVVTNEIQTDNIVSKRKRIGTRKIGLINLDENCEMLDLKNPNSKISEITSQDHTDAKILSHASTSFEYDLYKSDTSKNSDSCEKLIWNIPEVTDQDNRDEKIFTCPSNSVESDLYNNDTSRNSDSCEKLIWNIPEVTDQDNRDEKIFTYPSNSVESDKDTYENFNYPPSLSTENISYANEICGEIISNPHSNEEISSNSTNDSLSESGVYGIQNTLNQDVDIVISPTQPIEVLKPSENSNTNLDDQLLSPTFSMSNVSPDSFSGSVTNIYDTDDSIIGYTIKCNIDSEYESIQKSVIENKNISSSEDINNKLDFEYQENISDKKHEILTNSILLSCNKWISHRGPNLGSNVKLASMSVNRRMVWLTDTKGSLYVGFRQSPSDTVEITSEISPNNKMLWLNDSSLRTDKVSSSPNGFILWREKAGEVSVYTGMTKIWSPKVVKEKVLLKQNWESVMQGIKEIDIDEEMAVIVTKQGVLKVINGISSRTPYKQSKSADFAEVVTLASIFNYIIWCVTEINVPNTSEVSQHIFACFSRDENENLNIAHWRTVPLPKDLVREAEQHLGVMGGSKMIKTIQLGNGGLAWIVTYDNICFFCQNITPENPKGDGLWYQLTLQFVFQTPSYLEESIAYFSSELQHRVERIFGYSESDLKSKKVSYSSTNTSIILSVKSAPKNSQGNGLLWLTSTDRNSPSILFESDKNILGHNWLDCFQLCQLYNKRLTGLPALTSWSIVEISIKNTLWLLHKSGELFCYWNENKIRTISIPSAYGTVVKIAARKSTVIVLTSRSNILYRIGIVDTNPFGLDWREIKKIWSKQENIKTISCSDNEIWLITDTNVYYNEDLQALVYNTSKKLPWDALNFKLKDSHSKPLCMIQNSTFQNQNRIWGISDHDGYIYMSLWQPHTKDFQWTYVSSPRAKSIHVSNENLWLVEQTTGNIFVRCGLDWSTRPMGDYWIPVPFINRPVIDLAVSVTNQVFVIDAHERLQIHQWTIVEGISGFDANSTSQLEVSLKPDDQDWELLN